MDHRPHFVKTTNKGSSDEQSTSSTKKTKNKSKVKKSKIKNPHLSHIPTLETAEILLPTNTESSTLKLPNISDNEIENMFSNISSKRIDIVTLLNENNRLLQLILQGSPNDIALRNTLTQNLLNLGYMATYDPKK